MMGAAYPHEQHLGVYLVLAGLMLCRVASQNFCGLQKNAFMIDVSLSEAPEGEANNYEKRFLGFKGDSETISLEVEQDGQSVDFSSTFTIFTGIADFNYGFCIKRTGPLDRDGPTPKYSDDNNILEYTIVCTELETNNKFYYPLLIRINDVNDNPPVFRDEPFETTVDRNTAEGNTLVRVVATDKDLDRNRQIVYGIQKGSGELNDASQYFQFAVISSGALSLKQNINIDDFKREGITSMTLNIFAMDMGVKSLRTDSSIKININFDEKPIVKEEVKPVESARTTPPPVSTTESCELVHEPSFADDSIKVKLPEVTSISDLEEHPHKYRTFIGLENKVRSLRLEPQSNLVQVEYISTGSDRQGYYISFTGLVDRDNNIVSGQEGINHLNFNVTCMYGNRFVIFPLHLHISDVNDNTPVIEGTDFHFEMFDYFKAADLPIIVYEFLDHAVITDVDSGANNEVTFGVVPGSGDVLDASQYFSIDPLDGDISQKAEIDFDALQAAGSTTLFINVSVTDNAKHVKHRRTSFQVVEAVIQRSTTAAPPTTVRPTAGCKLADEPGFAEGAINVAMPEANNAHDLEDSDDFTKYIGLDGGVKLSMISDDSNGFNPGSYFQIVSENNRQYLKMIQPIDRDGNSVSSNDDTNFVEFTIKCKEPGASLYFPVRVDIIDINDNAPHFEDSPYLLNVNEGANPGDIVYGSISAVDKDHDEHSEIQYSIVPGDDSEDDLSDYFEIPDSKVGEIALAKSLDFEELPKQKFYLNISASDSGPVEDRQISYTSLEITITDSDDLGPVFVYPTCRQSNDVCLNPRYTSTIQSGIVAGRLTVFPVPADTDSDTGVSIVATDQDSFNVPIIFTIDQSIPDGYTDYFTVETSGPSDEGEYTAVVSQVKIVKRTNVPKLKLFIKATEVSAESRAERAEIDITVEQTNLNPPSLASSSGSFTGYVQEGEPAATFVSSSADDLFSRLQIVATDPDVSPADPKPGYEYSLDSSNVFTVDNQGFIQTKVRLDYEKQSEYSLTVTVTEADTPERRQATASLKVYVVDINDNSPTFAQKSFRANTTEGDYSTANKVLVKVKADDADSGEGGELAYSILDVRPDEGNLFTIDRLTGAISAVGDLTPDTLYSIRVQAVDNGDPPRSSVMVVEVYSQPKPNRMPNFSQPHYKIAVRENQKVNSQLLELSASDPDSDELIYSIIGGNLGEAFKIDENRGIVSIAQQLDYETVTSYLLTISATDPKGLRAVADIQVDIIDSNDNDPVFTASTYEAAVIEGDYSEATKVALQVSASDADSDENGEIDYSIIKMNPDEAGKISVDPKNGELEIVGEVRGEVTYTLTVQASDAGRPSRSSTAKVIISVIPTTVTSNAPVLPQTEYKVSVNENAEVGGEIVKLLATDPDGDDLKYTIINQDPATDSFAINEEGVISNTKLLDRESVDRYTLLVEVEDPTGLRAETRVVITVTDMNDNSPVFSHSQYEFSIIEGKKAEFTVVAFDSDEPSSRNSMISYSFLEPVDGFSISPKGKITSKEALDREEQAEYEMTVVASDNGVPALTSNAVVKIRVTDVADSVPVFNPSVYEAVIPEGKEGYLVTTVTATDADETKDIVFIFGEGDTSDFTLDSTTGEIRTAKALNVGSKPFYYFIVTTTDGKDTSSATVSITVQSEEVIAEREPIVSEPISPPVKAKPNRTEVVIGQEGDVPPRFKYPSCIGKCRKPEYSARVETGVSNVRLRLFPMPSDNPTLPVPLQAKDGNDPFNVLEFSVVRTVPDGYVDYFTLSKEGPDNTGFYRGLITLIKSLDVDRTPKLTVVIQATEVSNNALYAEAYVYIDVLRHYVLEYAPLKGSASTLSQFNIFSMLLLIFSTLLFV